MKDVRERLVQLAEGAYVEAEVLDVVAAIQEYDPNLVVKVLARGGEPDDPPYRLFEKCKDGIERIVFDIWELDHRVLERVLAADNARNNVLQSIDGANLLAEKVMTRRYEESILEADDIVRTFIKSRTKSKWTVKDGDRLITIPDTPGDRPDR